MSTLVRFRKLSYMEFEEQAKNIVAFLLKNMPRFPKSTRFIFQTKLSEISFSMLENIKIAQTFLIKDGDTKTNYLKIALGQLNCLETIWNLTYKMYQQQIPMGLNEELGELIKLERNLLLGVINSNKQML